MGHDVVARYRRRAGDPTPLQAAPQRRAGKIQKQGSDDSGMNQERIHPTKMPCGTSFEENAAERRDHGGDARQRRGIEVRSPLGDFPEPDRREVRARLRLDRNGIDESADLVLRRGGRAGGSRDAPCWRSGSRSSPC
jgi:hypothetical protein